MNEIPIRYTDSAVSDAEIQTDTDGNRFYFDYDAGAGGLIKVFLRRPPAPVQDHADVPNRSVDGDCGVMSIPHPSTVPVLNRARGRRPRVPENLTPRVRGFTEPPNIANYRIISIDNKKAVLDKQEVVRFMRNCFILAYNDEWYRFTGRIYEKQTDDDIMELLYTSLQKVPDCPFISRSTAADILAMLKYTSTIAALDGRKRRDVPTFDEDVDYAYDGLLIPFENGLYNYHSDVLLPYSPYIFVKRQYPVFYDPRIAEHPIERVYRNIIPDDDTRSFFFEMVGYTAYHPELSPPAIFLIYGPGETGKSALQKAVTELVGHDNVSVLDLAQISSEFGAIDLVDKVVNISGETGAGKTYTMTQTDGELLKRLSDGQTVTLNRKFKSTLTIKNTTKLWFITNTLPNFGDTSSGLYRRLYIIPCREAQVWEEQIHTKITQPDAVQWLANEAFEGYHRFLKRGCRFEPSELMKGELVHYQRQESLRDYLAEYFGVVTYEEVREALDGFYIADLYEGYKEYIMTSGGRPMSKRTMAEKLRNEFNMASDKTTSYIDGRRTTLVSLHRP